MKLSEILATVSTATGVLAPLSGALAPFLYATSVITGIASTHLQAKELKKRMKKGSAHLLNTVDTNANIPIVYGRCRVGGAIVFRNTKGDDNKYLYQVYTLSEGQITTVEDIYFDGHLPSYMKLISKSNTEYKYKLDSEVTNIRFDVLLTSHNIGYVTIDTLKYNEINLAKGDTYTDISNGFTFTATFGTDGILTISHNSADYYISAVTDIRFSFNNGVTYARFNDINDLYEYIWFDGENWYRQNSNGDWIVDNDTATNTILNEISTGSYTFDYSNISKPKSPVSLLCVKFKAKQGKWNGVPQVSALIQGIKKPNPFNNNTVETIDNPVWALFDYMTDKTYGLGIPYEEFEGYDTVSNTFTSTSTWKKAYDYCNAKGLKFNGALTEGNASDIVKQILDHFIGYTIKRNGKRECHYNYLNFSDTTYSNQVSSITIKEEDLLDTPQVTQVDWSSMPSKLEVRFLDEVLDYKENTITFELNSNINEDIATLEVLGASKSQAEWLGKYFLERQRNGFTVNLSLPHSYIDLDFGDIVYLDLSERNLSGYFRIVSKSVDLSKIDLSLIYESESFYNQTLDTYVFSYTPSEDINVNIVPPVVSATHTLIHKINADGTVVTYVDLDWSSYTYTWIDKFIIYASEDNTNWFVLGDTSDTKFRFQVSDTVSQYYIKVVAVSIYGVKSDFNTTSSIVIPVNPDGTTPSTPTGLSAITTRTSDNLSIYLKWNLNSEKDLAGYKIYISKSTQTFSDAVFFKYIEGNSVSFLFPSEFPTTYQSETSLKFYLTAIDNIGNESSPTEITVNTNFTPLETEINTVPEPTGTVNLTVQTFYDEWYLHWTGVSDDNYGYNVHIYSDSLGTTEVAVIKTYDTNFHYKENTTQQRWFKVVALKSDGTEATSTASTIVAGNTLPKVDAQQFLQQETITWNLISGDTKPPKVWTGASLPPVSDYPEGQLLYWTQDKKLYRNNGTSWIRKVAGDDIETNSITAGHIQAGAVESDKIKAGAILSSHIASDQIDGNHIKAGSITAGHISVTDLASISISTGGLTISDYIKSGSKTSVTDTTNTGLFIDNTGSFVLGNADNYLQFLSSSGELSVSGVLKIQATSDKPVTSIGKELTTDTVDGKIHSYMNISGNLYDIVSIGYNATNDSIKQGAIFINLYKMIEYDNTSYSSASGIYIGGFDADLTSGTYAFINGITIDMSRPSIDYGTGIQISSARGILIDAGQYGIYINQSSDYPTRNGFAICLSDPLPSPPTHFAPQGSLVTAYNNSGAFRLYIQTERGYNSDGTPNVNGIYGNNWKVFAFA